jgi:hypothetical protein
MFTDVKYNDFDVPSSKFLILSPPKISDLAPKLPDILTLKSINLCPLCSIVAFRG